MSNAWLPVPLIKHVYYGMSSRLSPYSTFQIHCVIYQKNKSFVFWNTCSHKTLLCTLYIYSHIYRFFFILIFCTFPFNVFDMQIWLLLHRPPPLLFPLSLQQYDKSHSHNTLFPWISNSKGDFRWLRWILIFEWLPCMYCLIRNHFTWFMTVSHVLIDLMC